MNRHIIENLNYARGRLYVEAYPVGKEGEQPVEEFTLPATRKEVAA